ncbi:hypothetical protein [Humisphaera borealis]|uniref:DUF1963 domain-containing protein n=1 Tax=Humisphaera borealis TaxID=2807512 RepID=A0A7M2WSX4_9BACT|nr:hypothetical protein [Humisphaera borealis]QOV88556.1 hypothetical protein IPV69_20265 [Humisphaera borealis]
MGIDISMYAEVRRQEGWQLAEPLARNPYRYDEDEPEWIPTALYSSRSYELFAVLANIRNPIRAMAPFEYLSEPRGLPADASPQLLDYYRTVESDSFSESWLLLEELTAFDWYGKEIIRRGVVNPVASHLFPPGRRGFPYADWPGGIQISVSEQGRGAEVQWIDTYAEAVGDEFMIDGLNRLKSYGTPKDVRVVFWFDC